MLLCLGASYVGIVSYLVLLGSITAVCLMAAASQGPTFLIVTQTSAGRSLRAGVLTALGVATTGTVWSSPAVLGLSFVFERFVWLYGVLKLLGGVMASLGARLMFSGR
jgi:threonine efflux protein